MSELAVWIAPVATMIAAMMTAANLGARVTGWGFVVFTLGSLCWAWVGMRTGQSNLLATNLFLTLVNLVGIWRWLGRQRAYEDGGKSAAIRSRRSSAPSLFTATGIAGMAVVDADRAALGRVVEALIECASCELSYVVVATHGIAGMGEELRAVSRDLIRFEGSQLVLDMPRGAFNALPPLANADWPASPANATAA